jgi:hypothetical protein
MIDVSENIIALIFDCDLGILTVKNAGMVAKDIRKYID